MSAEPTIVTTLGALVSNRVFPDVAPENTARPYITYQQVGGTGINFLDQATVPNKRHARFQINVWAETREEVVTLMGQVETALRGLTALQPTVEAAPVASYEPDTGLRGSRQDFSFLS